MKKSILIRITFLLISISAYNKSYNKTEAEISYENNPYKDKLVKEDYIKYFSYIFAKKESVENFSAVDLSKINIKNLPYPYNQLEAILSFNPFGWYSNREYIKKLFDSNNFLTAIEIGSWFGLSARHIASLLPGGSKLYAIDPWNYFTNHYEQFLSNIVISGLTHKVISLKESSDKAIEFFREMNEKIDFICVDGSHEFAVVLSDLENYFPILSSTGVICGDDWLWIEVRAAVKEFAQKYNLTIYADCTFWFLKKEDCGYCYKSLLTADDSAWKFGSK